MVRALPDESACLISEVCLRVSVIFFFSGAVRLGQCRIGGIVLDAGRGQLLDQCRDRHLELFGQLGDGSSSHCYLSYRVRSVML